MTTTWNPSDKGSAAILSNGNLTWTAGGSATNGPLLARATDYHIVGLGAGNKWYFEAKIEQVHFGNRSPAIALVDALQPYNHRPGDSSPAILGWAIYTRSGTLTVGQTWSNGVTTDLATFYDAGDVVMIAVDFTVDPGKIWFGLNGSWLAGNPAAGTGAAYSNLTGKLYPAVWGTRGRTIAASATGRFVGAQQQYTPPTGFTAWGDSVAAPPSDPVPPDPGDGSDPGTPIDLWRVNPRQSSTVPLFSQFGVDPNGERWVHVSPNLFFVATTDDIQQTAFAITDTDTASFVSKVAYGPAAAVLPCDWFHSDVARRVILVEVDYATQSGSGATGVPAKSTLYLSDRPYFDDVNSRVYRDCLAAIPRYRRSLDRNTLRGRYTATIGSLEINNADGQFDGILDYALDGSEVRVLIGDETWTRAQFIPAFTALAVRATATSYDRISIALKDTGLLLNAKVGGAVAIGGTGPSADKFRPFNFGIVRQVECILQDKDTLTYVHSESGDNTSLLAVRCRGDSIVYTDNFDGTFSLGVDPAGGVITADVVVTNGYDDQDNGTLTDTFDSCRVSDAFYQFAGLRAGLLEAGYYNGASGNFDLLGVNDLHTGISIAQARNIVDVLDDICNAGNCYWAVLRNGQFVFGWIRPEAIDFIIGANLQSIATITRDNLLDNGKALRITKNDPTYYSVQGYGNKNWLDQSDFAGELSASDLQLYRRKGYQIPPEDGTDDTATTYLGPESTAAGFGTWFAGAPQLYHKTMTTTADVETIISCETDADCGIELDLWQSVRRSQFLPWVEFVDIDVDLCHFQLELGNIVTLDLTEADGTVRFGLGSGKTYQVIDIDIGLTEDRVSLGLVRRRPAITTTYLA